MQVKEIPLTQGQVALVDDEDYERASAHNWYAARRPRTFYVARESPRDENGVRRILTMPNFLLGISIGVLVDHIDGNGLNNVRSNLRLATAQQNQRNRRKTTGCSSQYKGVSWHTQRNKWKAYIKVDRRQIHLGLFTEAEQAARAYDAAARSLFGEFAILNFPAV